LYRIRFHGRGGQGVKTAGRILGSALFAEGFEVQDAPRYGAERRGAPIFATVRADRREILERGPIRVPDLVVVADDSLVSVAAAGVLVGADRETVLLLDSDLPAETWRERLRLEGLLLTLPSEARERAELRFVGATCAGAAARLLGVISRTALEGAIRAELAAMKPALVEENQRRALAAFERFESHAGCVGERSEPTGEPGPPHWIELPFDDVGLAAPDIHGAATSVQVRTGLWRTMRPVIELERCNRCHWVCSTLCPDGAIELDEDGAPRIDYDHCKGCLVCVAVCPPHAIVAVPESEAAAESSGEAPEVRP
jgi:pyruvate ferredoxin oxidoreductase gamma subunit